MSARAARLLAATTLGLFALLVLATAALVTLAGAPDDELIVVALAGFAVVGTLIAARRPRNAVGWLLLLIGSSFAFGAATEAYLGSDLDAARGAVGWLSSGSTWIWLTTAGVFLPLVFPHGTLLSPRWRWVLRLGLLALACLLAGTVLKRGALDLDTEGIENPLALGGAAGDVVDVLQPAGLVLLIAAIALSAASLILRFRRSRGSERQQLKWFAFVGGLALACLFAAAVVTALGPEPPVWAEAVGTVGWFSALALIMLGLPIATGIAILRHRLYDIDVVIRRTLVYGALTATLGAVYLGLVLLSGLAVGDSDLAIAAATLAVAALFRPALGRIQAGVDRRFFRRRYDASRTLEAFGARLREELDLEALGADLRDVVADTVQPAHVSLWLRSGS